MGRLGDWTRKAALSPFKLLVPRNPWVRLLLLLLVISLLLAFLEPVLRLALKGVELLGQIMTPMLDNPVGRLVLTNLLLLVIAFGLWRMLRGRLRSLQSGLVLRRHLQGLDALLAEQPRRARELFTRVARSRAAGGDVPFLPQDACLKLARLALDANEPNAALAHLARIRERGLPKELRRSAAQLEAEACFAQGQILPETVERELRETCREFPDDVRMLALLRRLLRARGELDEAAAVQERIVKHAPPRAQALERERLVHDLVDAARAALDRDEHVPARALARRAQRADPDAVAPGSVLGEILLAQGDVRGAIREWGATRSPQGLEQVARLLDERPDVLTPRELLELCPLEGALLLVARQLARAGEHRKALRAARRAARALGPTPTVTAVLAEVLTACGQVEEARTLGEAALRRLVAPEPRPG